MLIQKNREGCRWRGLVNGGRGDVAAGKCSGGKGRGLRSAGMAVRDVEGVRGRESTILCQFPPGLLLSITSSSKKSFAISASGIPLSLADR